MLSMENWKETIDAMDSCQAHEINEEVFYYFLEVLPPVFMGKKFLFADGKIRWCSFGFAEGAEPVTVFWKEKEKYFLQRTGKYAEDLMAAII